VKKRSTKSSMTLPGSAAFLSRIVSSLAFLSAGQEIPELRRALLGWRAQSQARYRIEVEDARLGSP